ncbi:hypothetical protein PtA15_11A306 [Puccinia triticina]|uniref:Uncharacterized protein n=1 Tax=Puccinia triticina TaxID=208348 RepID=A0ABY7CWG4_9BASI|nr:uncharacterized protein PtA15_11A306 [Puccinia triticina]WAQ89616.1 hypothetical protein PtA15_11A306 [Puccinia triticina]
MYSDPPDWTSCTPQTQAQPQKKSRFPNTVTLDDHRLTRARPLQNLARIDSRSNGANRRTTRALALSTVTTRKALTRMKLMANSISQRRAQTGVFFSRFTLFKDFGRPPPIGLVQDNMRAWICLITLLGEITLLTSVTNAIPLGNVSTSYPQPPRHQDQFGSAPASYRNC